MIKNNLVRVKDHPPYTPDLEDKVLLNSLARVSPDPKTGSYIYTAKQNTTAAVDSANVKTVSDLIAGGALAGSGEFVGVGVDQGEFPTFSQWGFLR